MDLIIITEKAAGYGLDFYPTHFEVVPDHVIYELGSYVLPARFSHWTFGARLPPAENVL